ncbi:MAG TPA: hypothetical protein VGM04_03390 [Sphingomicrobium sp.]|jgi:hypothetical protein
MFARSIRTCLFPLLLVSATAATAAEAPDDAAKPAQLVDTQTVEVADASATESAQPAEPAPAPQGTETAVPNPNDGKWHFATIGYAWLAGAWGKTDVIGPLPPVDLDLPFGKVLKGFKFAFMGAAEARHDRFVVVGDLIFIHLASSEGIGVRDPDFLKAKLDSRTTEVTLLPGYRVVDKGPVTVDLLVGARANWFNTGLHLSGPNREADASVKHWWLDPLIATRIGAPLGGKWSANFYGDLGGIIAGSQVTWQAVPTISYQINHKMSVGAGWRYFKVNYRDGDFLYNVHQSGPIITFRTVM